MHDILGPAVAVNYKLLPDLYNQSKAHDMCVSQGGHLPLTTSNNMAELDASMKSHQVTEVWINLKKTSYSKPHWIDKSTGGSILVVNIILFIYVNNHTVFPGSLRVLHIQNFSFLE